MSQCACSQKTKEALEVFEELRTRKAEVDRLQRSQVERVRQEAELAQRQYMLVRPENRLVADNLERQWNQKLTELAEAEEQYRQTSRADGIAVSAEDRARIQSLVSDLPRVWNDPRTPSRERKRLLRFLVEDVTLLRGEVIRIHIRWKGGATTVLERPIPLRAPELRRTPASVVEIVRALAGQQTDSQIAGSLNSRGLRSGTGQSFSGVAVRRIRTTYGIESLMQRLRGSGWLTALEMAARLDIHRETAKRFAQEGVLRAVRADDRGQILMQLNSILLNGMASPAGVDLTTRYAALRASPRASGPSLITGSPLRTVTPVMSRPTSRLHSTLSPHRTAGAVFLP